MKQEKFFANLKLSGQDNSLYYFDNENAGHYDKNGKSIKKALMKTPINGARLSSPFGMRKHPIDGYKKCIEVQILRSNGTPIMASGDGVIKAGGVEVVEIVLKLNHETIYAHMSKFAEELNLV